MHSVGELCGGGVQARTLMRRWDDMLRSRLNWGMAMLELRSFCLHPHNVVRVPGWRCRFIFSYFIAYLLFFQSRTVCSPFSFNHMPQQQTHAF